MFKVNLIQILFFIVLILFQYVYCNNDIKTPENEFQQEFEMLHDQDRGLEKRSRESVYRNLANNELVTGQINVYPIDRLNFDTIQNTPNIIYLLTDNQQTNRINKHRYLTPRLGRDVDELLEFQSATSTPLFAPPQGKKTVHFSPRLGRRLYAR